MTNEVQGLTPAQIGRQQHKRVVLLDALRGVCLVVMTIDHSPANPVHRFSNTQYGFVGFFTGALGFIFLSGVVAGRVYDKDRSLRGIRSMCGRVLRRMRAIYFTQILAFALLLAAVELHLRGDARWHLDLVGDTPWKGIVFSATLLYEPDYCGLLPMYLVFLLLTPIVLSQFSKGNVATVLAVSAAIWLASGLLVRLPTNPSGVDFGPFNPICYQFLFVVGLAFGANQLSIERLRPVVRKWLIGSSVVLATAYFALRLQYALGGPLDALVDDVSSLYSATRLGPLRLLNFAAFGFVLYWRQGFVERGRSTRIPVAGFRGSTLVAGLRVVDSDVVCVDGVASANAKSHIGCDHHRSRDGQPDNPGAASRHDLTTRDEHLPPTRFQQTSPMRGLGSNAACFRHPQASILHK